MKNPTRASTQEAKEIWEGVAEVAKAAPEWLRELVTKMAHESAQDIVDRLCTPPEASEEPKCMLCGRPTNDGRACPEDFPDGLHVGARPRASRGARRRYDD